MELLAQNNAALDIVDHKDCAPLDIALTAQNTDLIGLLVSKLEIDIGWE